MNSGKEVVCHHLRERNISSRVFEKVSHRGDSVEELHKQNYQKGLAEETPKNSSETGEKGP